MIGYVTLGTNNYDKAVAFYDALMGEMGAGRFMESDSFVAWATAPDAPSVCVIKPHDGKPATVGNGVMVALHVESPEKVDALYKKVLELGGTDEGEPGERMDGFYAAYFRDLDGNKLNFFAMTSA
ncbi:glyoxalase [Kordiimonas sediminis]|uniref:Glyoxalase n=1 Tax=Kordiimonas sediminis TaxID=1735581 RepID=A0A919AUM9_9PROT|nr:VOC family protein [Kordiimonas sediminis]GHF24038.1 glyoxalase [Kordiimonas sediminis]